MAEGLKGLLGRTDFRRLFIGQTVSGLGDWIATFAFIALVYSLTHSTTGVAVVLILRLLPPLFAAPVGGLLADRLPRRTIMIVSDISRGILILLVPFSPIWLVYVIALVHEFISLFFLPSRDASIPELAKEHSLEQANGLMMASSYGSLPIAGAFFSLLNSSSHLVPHAVPFSATINAQPTSLAFIFDSVTFFVSAWFVSRIRISYKGMQEPTENSTLRELMAGLAFWWQQRGFRSLAYGTVMAMFGGGVLFAVGIAYVRQTLHGSDSLFGWLAALWGTGMGVGLLGVRLVLSHRSRLTTFATAIFACGALLVLMSLLPITWLALTLAVPFGSAFSLALMLALSIVQSSVDEVHRGRMMGSVQMLYRLGLGGGAITMGLLAHSLHHVNIGVNMDGNQFGMLVGGLLIISAALAILPLAKHQELLLARV